MPDQDSSPMARRSFLSRFGVGITAFGVTLGSSVGKAQSTGGRWQPGRHVLDDWLDQLPGQHRLLFDTTTLGGLGGALLYANNYFLANQTGYNLGNAELAVVIVMRHNSTPFAYNDAIWAKYGAVLAQRGNVTDPQTQAPPKVNLYNSPALAAALPSQGTTLDSLIKKGAHLAVCQMATRRLAGAIAQATSTTADGAYNELVTNLVGNSHIVPAGIVAVNRAQERGYSFTNVGV
jgi:intracellular sulfur oxidation DsrE/DsrF family protein